MRDRMDETREYDDIIDLKHHCSSTRAHMPRLDRAAQFAPFAALTGFDEHIKEAARLTHKKPELDENAKAILNDRLRLAQAGGSERPRITIVCFEPDERKAGGAIVDYVGVVRRVDEIERRVILFDGTSISIDDILEIGGDAFFCLE